MADEKKSFVMYESWAVLLAGLSEEDAGQIIKAICSKKIGREYEIKNQTAQAVFDMITPQLEKDSEKYIAKCEKNKKIANDREKNKQDRAQDENVSKEDTHERVTNVSRTLNERATNIARTSGDSDSDSESDSDIDTDSVSVNDTEPSSKAKKEKHPTGAKRKRSASATHKVRFPEDAQLDEAFNNFAEMRKKIRAPLTDNAEKLIMDKLMTLSNGNREDMIAILNQSTENSWRGVFPLRREEPHQPRARNSNTEGFNASNFLKQEIARMKNEQSGNSGAV